MCDFYITSDKKNYRKAKTIFEKLKINTLVFTPSEFIEYYKQWLHFTDGNQFLRLIWVLIEHGQPYISDDNKQKTYWSPFFIFDYFNKLYIVIGDQADEISVVLTKEKPTNNRNTYLIELVVLVKKLIATFGNDIENIGDFKESEMQLLHNNTWLGRDGFSLKLNTI